MTTVGELHCEEDTDHGVCINLTFDLSVAGSKTISIADNKGEGQDSRFKRDSAVMCDVAPITSDCSLSKQISKSFKNSKI